MSPTSPQPAAPKPEGRKREGGFTLVETIFALVILMIVAAGVAPLALVAVKATENQGHLAARTTEYAQDKLEQLMALSYGDSATDTRVFPSVDLGGTGLAIGGSHDPAAPEDKYVDYLDIDGNLIEDADDGGTEWFYKRVWSVTTVPDAAGNPRPQLKQITVTATVRVASQGGAGQLPRSTVSALKTNPF
ncbi:MAG TPA: prepilin-type N-terminal cleavage/methylation domain-containing protein [Vicinamibacterales bacterium]|nr:prepilin-type N-terminal cleavage/methylation domain-containing protein [Vicinamibacterales bacterium]